jgi:hypothetical protein
MKTIGALMWIIGLMAFLGALFGMDTSLPISTVSAAEFGDRVVNLQLQQLQSLVAQGGLALFVAGVIAHCAGNLAEALGGPSPAAINHATYASQFGEAPAPAQNVAEMVGAGETDEVLVGLRVGQGIVMMTTPSEFRA